MILKIEAKYKASQLIELETAQSVKEIQEVQVNKKGIDVYLKDGTVHNFIIEIEDDPYVATWELVRNYKPLEDEVVNEKPKRKPKPKKRVVDLPESLELDDDTQVKVDDPDPFE